MSCKTVSVAGIDFANDKPFVLVGASMSSNQSSLPLMLPACIRKFAKSWVFHWSSKPLMTKLIGLPSIPFVVPGWRKALPYSRR